MPQGKGTYGSKVGRPSEDETILGGSSRTSFVNDNKWWDKLKEGFNNLGAYEPKKLIRSMEFREGLSSPKKELTAKDDRWWNEGYKKEGALLGYTEDQVEMQRKYNKRLKKPDNASGY